jgi:hypothetical protein
MVMTIEAALDIQFAESRALANELIEELDGAVLTETQAAHLAILIEQAVAQAPATLPLQRRSALVGAVWEAVWPSVRRELLEAS